MMLILATSLVLSLLQMLTKLLLLLAQIRRGDGGDEVDGDLGSEIRCVRL